MYKSEYHVNATEIADMYCKQKY